jgi:hypothetical protein
MIVFNFRLIIMNNMQLVFKPKDILTSNRSTMYE